MPLIEMGGIKVLWCLQDLQTRVVPIMPHLQVGSRGAFWALVLSRKVSFVITSCVPTFQSAHGLWKQM